MSAEKALSKLDKDGKKVVVKKAVKKKTVISDAKKVSSKKPANKPKTKKATTTKKVNKKTPIVKKVKEDFGILNSEYYEFPKSYSNTTLKLLFQTPNIIFVYWNVNAKDADKLKKTYGENFFYDTYPVLIVENETENYTFEQQINDYANCWYINVNKPHCKYNVKLGRKVKENITLTFEPDLSEKQHQHHANHEPIDNFISLATSNKISTPNDHILFKKAQETITYKNIRTNEIETRKNDLYSNDSNLIYDIYKKLYTKEFEDLNSTNKIASSHININKGEIYE